MNRLAAVLLAAALTAHASGLIVRQGLQFSRDTLFHPGKVPLFAAPGESVAHHLLAAAAADEEPRRVLLCSNTDHESVHVLRAAAAVCNPRELRPLGDGVWSAVGSRTQLGCMAQHARLCGIADVPVEWKIAESTLFAPAGADEGALRLLLVPGSTIRDAELRELLPDWTREHVSLEHTSRRGVTLRPAHAGDGRLRTDALRAAAAKLAQHPAVDLVERASRMRSLNSFARWVTQSDMVDEYPLTDSGLDGLGEVVGVADTGLDVNHCYFYDPAHPVPYVNVSGNGTALGPASMGVGTSEHRKVAVYVEYADRLDAASGHGTHVCGSVAGNSTGKSGLLGSEGGMAPSARIAFFDVGEGGKRFLSVPSDLDHDMFEWLYVAGARVMSNSWGDVYNFYADEDRQVDVFSARRPDALVLFAAGNAGECGSNTVGSPGNAKNSITVGASRSALGTWEVDCQQWQQQNPGASCVNNAASWDPSAMGRTSMAYFSSQGPTYDGRLKVRVVPRWLRPSIVPVLTPDSQPDLVAPGYYVISARSDGQVAGAPNCAPNLCTHYAHYNCSASDGLLVMAGTSMATPVTAGNAALVRQYLREGRYPTGVPNPSRSIVPQGALLKALLLTATTDMRGFWHIFDKWGQDKGNVPLDAAPSAQQGYGRLLLNSTLPLPSSDATMMPSLFLDQWSAVDSAGAAGGGVLPGAVVSTVTRWSSGSAGEGVAEEVQVHASYRDYCFTATPGAASLNNDAGRVRFTLTWTDPAPSEHTPLVQVHDLDLAVAATVLSVNGPNASVRWFLGNGARSRRTSATLAPEVADTLNTVEQVTIRSLAASSMPGANGLSGLRVRVWASSTLVEPQRFALVGSARGLQNVSCSHPAVPDAACPNDCSAQGECVNSACRCSEGFTGVDCSATTCPLQCSNRGSCSTNGTCSCSDGFVGAWCQHLGAEVPLGGSQSVVTGPPFLNYFKTAVADAGNVRVVLRQVGRHPNATLSYFVAFVPAVGGGQPPHLSSIDLADLLSIDSDVASAEATVSATGAGAVWVVLMSSTPSDSSVCGSKVRVTVAMVGSGSGGSGDHNGGGGGVNLSVAAFVLVLLAVGAAAALATLGVMRWRQRLRMPARVPAAHRMDVQLIAQESGGTE